MDERRREVMAAAQAIRAWVSQQRTTWTDVPLPVFVPALAAPAPEPVALALYEPSFAAVVETSPATWADPSDREPGSPGVLTHFRERVSQALAQLARAWRPVLGVALVIAAAWAVRTNWQSWTGSMETGLAVARRTAAAAPPKALEMIDRQIALRRPATAGGGAGARPTGSLDVDTDPAGAQVMVDGLDRGVTPVVVDALTPGSHSVVLRSDAGTVVRTATIEASATTQLREAIFAGWLRVSSPIDLQLSIGTRRFRLDDNNQTLMPPGSHDVLFENRDLGFREVRHVDVQPGRTTNIAIEPSFSAISVIASEPATVKIDGAVVGETPLTDHPVDMGAHEVVVTAASGAFRRFTPTVTTQPTRLEADFSKP